VKGESEVRSGGLGKWLMAVGVVCLIVYLLMNLSGDMGTLDTRISNAALLVGLAALVGGIVLYMAKEGSKK
jgi:lipopolysaccharide export LptBFGC system permease protein LptF